MLKPDAYGGKAAKGDFSGPGIPPLGRVGPFSSSPFVRSCFTPDEFPFAFSPFKFGNANKGEFIGLESSRSTRPAAAPYGESSRKLKR